MSMLQQTAPTRFHPQAYQHNAETITLVDVIDPHLGVTIIIGTTTMTIAEVTLDLFTDPHVAAHHATGGQAHTITVEMHHTTDPHHAGISLEITVAPGHAQPANTITKPPKDHLPAQIKQPGSPRTGNTSKSPLMTHPQSTIALMNRTATQRMI